MFCESDRASTALSDVPDGCPRQQGTDINGKSLIGVSVLKLRFCVRHHFVQAPLLSDYDNRVKYMTSS